MKFDPKSPLPRSQQVRDQVIQFKGLNRMKTKQFTSMDRFKEMIQIEKEFGPVNLGHDPDDPTVKPRTTTSTNIRRHRPNRSPEESSSSQELSDDNLDKLNTGIEKTILEDNSEAIILGCAGMSNLAKDLELNHGLPVIEGVSSAVVLTEGLINLQIKTSKIGSYALPRDKNYIGYLSKFRPKS